MWVPFLRPFPGNEAHQLFSGPKIGCFGWGTPHAMVRHESVRYHIWPLRPRVPATGGPKPQKCPKWLGEGAKGVLDPGSKGLPRVFCTTKTLFCTGATLFCTNARGLWRPCPKGPFAPSPNHFWEFSTFRPSPRTFGSQIWPNGFWRQRSNL